MGGRNLTACWTFQLGVLDVVATDTGGRPCSVSPGLLRSGFCGCRMPGELWGMAAESLGSRAAGRARWSNASTGHFRQHYSLIDGGQNDLAYH